jgi:hypothetical protein
MIVTWRFFRPCAFCAATLGFMCSLIACSTAPVDQVKYFSQAVNSVDTVGQSLIDDLATAERSQGQRAAVRRSKTSAADADGSCASRWMPVSNSVGFMQGFCMADSAYYSLIGDPPATKSLRAALQLLGDFAGVLSALTQNTNIDAAQGQIDTLVGNFGALASIVSGTALPLGAAVSALKPIVTQLVEARNAEEARRAIVDGKDGVSTLISGLRKSTPAVFNTLTEESTGRLRSREVSADPALAAPDLRRVDAYRVTVSNFVVMLGKLQDAWNLTVKAAESPENPITLSALAERSGELKADAEAARRAFSILRTGGTMPTTQ